VKLGPAGVEANRRPINIIRGERSAAICQLRGRAGLLGNKINAAPVAPEGTSRRERLGDGRWADRRSLDIGLWGRIRGLRT
jgi:hypothetical protein